MIRSPKRLPKGEIVERRIATTWYFWRCPETGCRTELKATVEQFVLVGAKQHQDKHQRDRDKEVRLEKARQALQGVNWDLLTKIGAQRIDNGWVVTETGKEADGSTYKHTRSFKAEKEVMAAFGHALEMSQTKLDEDGD